MNWLREIDKTIEQTPKINGCYVFNKIYLSADIYYKLNIKKYKEFRIYTSVYMPPETIIIKE